MALRDPIIERLHRIREAIGRQHGFDARRIAGALREEEEANGRKVVSRAPRRPARSRKAS
jgi:hypothetical protein